MRRGLAWAVAILLACDLAVVGVRLTDPRPTGGSGAGGGPPSSTPPGDGSGAPGRTAPGQRTGPGPGAPAGPEASLAGTAASLAADAADAGTLAVPLTLEAPRGEGRAVIRQALVGGERVTIEWDAGQDLPLAGDGGGLDLAAAHVEAGPGGARVALDGATHALVPGRYRAGAPVAIGAGGLARPAEGAEFVADERTTLTTRGGVVARTAAGELHLRGPGRLSATGVLLVRTGGGLRTAASITFGPGPFEVRLRPRPDGYEVAGTMQGPLEVQG